MDSTGEAYLESSQKDGAFCKELTAGRHRVLQAPLH